MAGKRCLYRGIDHWPGLGDCGIVGGINCFLMSASVSFSGVNCFLPVLYLSCNYCYFCFFREKNIREKHTYVNNGGLFIYHFCHLQLKTRQYEQNYGFYGKENCYKLFQFIYFITIYIYEGQNNFPTTYKHVHDLIKDNTGITGFFCTMKLIEICQLLYLYIHHGIQSSDFGF